MWSIGTIWGHNYTPLCILRSAQRMQLVQIMGVKTKSTGKFSLNHGSNGTSGASVLLNKPGNAVKQTVTASKQKVAEWTKHISQFGTIDCDCDWSTQTAPRPPRSWSESVEDSTKM
eukprot:TRINITY_DN94659_c0_g1_i1.p1 TRINITY_DN94659_c0_g1~~TRINITY_DN94659_c0_g1_i1.p1  ORF type:complete len:116 (-),score=16.36 TRINITY_DN94659_c0_g1_i1:189-536(-)